MRSTAVAPPGETLLAAFLTSEAFVRTSQQQPVTGDLLRAVITQCAHVADAIAANASDVPQQLRQLTAITSEVLTWLTDQPIPRLSPKEIERSATEWLHRGALTLPLFTAIVSKPDGRPRKGCPPKQRTRVITRLALDKKRTNPKQSWAKLATDLKYCIDHVSAHECGERMRKQAAELERLLARLSSGEKA